jgi:ankyrin repeat protein
LGRTPLSYARDAGILALLIAAEADVNAVDDSGMIACHQACANPPVLAQLLDAGANPLARSKFGATPLHHAAVEKDAIDAILLLIRANAAVNECDCNGNSASHWAAHKGRVENLKLLIAHGAQINQCNNAGKTMLALAASARENALEVMRLLIDSGADTSVINDTVAFRANASVFRLLRSFGVNFNAVGENGNTPSHEGANNSQKLVALFALGATMTAVNNDGKTPYEMLCAADYESLDDAVVTFVAAGLGFGVQTQFYRTEIAAVVIAGGGFVSAEAFSHDDDDDDDDPDEVFHALHRIEERQTELFRARAFHVCVGLQSLRLSALEMCEILAHMFAPLESIVPFHVVWKVVTSVKHFKRISSK